MIKFVPSTIKTEEEKKKYRFGCRIENYIDFETKKKMWMICDISKIYERSYNRRFTAFEIFLKNGNNYFFNVFERKTLKLIFQTLKKMTKSIEILTDLKKTFKEKGYTEKWLKGELSNFDYLMQINTFSGRSYNDLQQYFVFPWILKNYETHKLDLNDLNNFRDLRLPIGALNPERLKEYKERYKAMKENYKDDLNIKPFMYGSHYSGNTSVLSFLIRIEPVTSLCIKMQNGKFDEADRIFGSIGETWETVNTHLADVKELVPEFFYCPQIFRNL